MKWIFLLVEGSNNQNFEQEKNEDYNLSELY